MSHGGVRFKVVIPARYASSRLPAKPLLDLGGKPMVARVAERAALSGAEEVWIATDHADIQAAAARHGLSVLLTRADHPTGTDRLAEVVEQRGWDDESIVVNVQGDEPLIDPELIAQVASQLAVSGADITTLAHPLEHAADFQNPNVVKVVCKADGDALYFPGRRFLTRAITLPVFPAKKPCLPGFRRSGILAFMLTEYDFCVHFRG